MLLTEHVKKCPAMSGNVSPRATGNSHRTVDGLHQLDVALVGSGAAEHLLRTLLRGNLKLDTESNTHNLLKIPTIFISGRQNSTQFGAYKATDRQI